MRLHSTGEKSWWLVAFTSLVLLGCFMVGVTSASPILPRESILPAAPPPAPQLLCSGPLTFASPVTYTASTRPRSSALALLSNDNNLDLVITDYSANGISVF